MPVPAFALLSDSTVPEEIADFWYTSSNETLIAGMIVKCWHICVAAPKRRCLEGGVWSLLSCGMALGCLGLLSLPFCMGTDEEENDSNMADNIVYVHCDVKVTYRST